MKKFLFLFYGGVILLFLVASPLYARSATPASPLKIRERIETQFGQSRPSTPSFIREPQEQLREEIRQRVQERRATIEGRLAERKIEIIKTFFARLVKRLEAAIARLEKLISRIEARLDKIEASRENINTANIRKEVEKAKTKLADARATLEEAKDKIQSMIESETPKEVFTEIRTLIQNVKRQLIEVHRILVKVIGDIKGLRVGTISTPSATGE
jgi:methyl-accepting chemotaxis protein